MRCIRYNVAATLDGFIASPPGSTPWIIEDSSIDFDALYTQFSTFIMGRKSYETMLAYGDQNPLKGKPRESMIVVSRSLKQEDYPDVTILNSFVVEFVWGLKRVEGDGKDIWLFGGGQVARILLEAGLVDVVEVAIMPVLIGNGIKLVAGEEEGNWKLKLESVERLDSGILMTRHTVIHG